MKNEENHAGQANPVSHSPTAQRDFLKDGPLDMSSTRSKSADNLVAWARNRGLEHHNAPINEFETLDQTASGERTGAATRGHAGSRTRRGLLASLAGGLLALAGAKSQAVAQGGSTVTLCFRGVTLTVPELAADTLLAQGATRGACATNAQETLCFRGVTLTVPEPAASALLARGATRGACQRDGAQGPQGPQGGPQGPQGGPQGPQGGPQGPQGPQGVQGTQGLLRHIRDL